jgi:GTP cyclohydrolase I
MFGEDPKEAADHYKEIAIREQVLVERFKKLEDLANDPEAHALAILESLPAWDRAPKHHREKTPARFLHALHQMTDREEFNFTTFPANGLDEMITLGPIPFYTLCVHHVVPFYGNAWVGYVPRDKMAGLSKFPRAVKYMAKGLWVQEELTIEIADYLVEKLDPTGLAIVIKAEHMCMAARGIQQPGVVTTTSAMRGVFADHSRTAKVEFLEWIHNV